MAGKKKETFDDRLRIHYDELKWLYMELYENDDMFGELCEQMRWYDGQRKPALKKLDQKRKAQGRMVPEERTAGNDDVY